MALIYWIPIKTPNFNPQSYVKKFLYKVDINQDLGEWEVHFLLIPEAGKFGKIIIFEENGKDLAVLEIIDFTSSGFLLLKELYSDNRLKDGYNTDKFTDTLYHIIKEFWHEHEFHSNDEDTLLRGLRIDCSKLEECKEYIAEHFLNLFFLKFAEADKRYSLIPPEKGYLSFFKKLFKFWDFFKLTKLEESLNFLLGEGIYFFNLKQGIKDLKIFSLAADLEKIYSTIENLLDSLERKRNNIISRRDAILNFWTFLMALLGVVLAMLGITLNFS